MRCPECATTCRSCCDAAACDEVAGQVADLGPAGPVGQRRHRRPERRSRPRAAAARRDHLERLLGPDRERRCAWRWCCPTARCPTSRSSTSTSTSPASPPNSRSQPDRAAGHGLELWVESLHILRLCHSLPRALQLTSALAGTPVGVVMDFSHIVASGARPRTSSRLFADRIRHVHLRDASPGNIHHSIGNGAVDFAGAHRRTRAWSGYERPFHPRARNPRPHRRRTPRPPPPGPPPSSPALSTRPAAGAVRTTQAPGVLPPDAATHLRRNTMTTSTQRTVVITGVAAERGIGRATAHRFARDGWAVAALDLDGAAAEKLAAELTERYGVPAFGGAVDVADEDSVTAAARDAVRGPTCRWSARCSTSPASPPRCRSWTPPSRCGTRSSPSTPPAPTWSPRRSCRT